MAQQFKVEITGFLTREDAEAFANWYSESGEQDASIWFEERWMNGESESDSYDADAEASRQATENIGHPVIIVKPNIPQLDEEE